MKKKIEPEKKWYEHEEVKIGYGACPEPYQNIVIGSYPMDGATKEWADQFDAVVNVSCNHSSLFEPSRPDQRTYWYPLNEGGQWSYAYFALMFKVLDFHYEKGHKVYVHCAAGAYRSPTIVMRWLEYRGMNIVDAYNISHGENARLSKWRDEKQEKEGNTSFVHFCLFQNYILGNLPPNYKEFILRLRHDNEETGYTYASSIDGISSYPEVRAFRRDNDPITKFFRKMKYKLNTIKEMFGLYWRNERQVKIGYYRQIIRNYPKIAWNRDADISEFFQNSKQHREYMKSKEDKSAD